MGIAYVVAEVNRLEKQCQYESDDDHHRADPDCRPAAHRDGEMRRRINPNAEEQSAGDGRAVENDVPDFSDA